MKVRLEKIIKRPIHYVLKCFFCIFFFIFSNIFKVFFYKSSYLKSSFFEFKVSNIFNPSWQWIFNDIIHRIVFHENWGIPWPVSPKCHIGNFENVLFFPEEIHNFQDNVYFQAINGRIIIGKDVYIAPNVGLINSNHDINKLENHINGSDIVIGNCSWIGMNSVILPGVILGDKTIVGAGSVVTKSFKMGNVIIAGNPAKIIKKINEG